MMRVDYDLDTPSYLHHGITVFQAGLVDNDEAATVRRIHDAFDLVPGAVVADMGCGVGGVARLMTRIDPSLRFICLTNSALQFEIVSGLKPLNIVGVLADYHATELSSASVDGVMFNESLGYGDRPRALREARRILKPGGKLLVKDLHTVPGSPAEEYEEFSRAWGYKSQLPEEDADMARAAGLRLVHSEPLDFSFERSSKFIESDPWMRRRYGIEGPVPPFEAWIQVFQVE